jgi:MFS transporter, PPP family, 3-phenylpropionic acid transporter
MLWAVGVVAEVAFLALAANRLGRFRPELLILVGGLGAMIRWSVLAFSPGFWVASAVQLLHAGTFAATHIGFMRLLEVEVHPDQRPTGQQLASSILMSPVMGLASIGAGWLYDHFGVDGYWSGVVLAACGIACVSFVLLRARVRLKPL